MAKKLELRWHCSRMGDNELTDQAKARACEIPTLHWPCNASRHTFQGSIFCTVCEDQQCMVGEFNCPERLRQVADWIEASKRRAWNDEAWMERQRQAARDERMGSTGTAVYDVDLDQLDREDDYEDGL